MAGDAPSTIDVPTFIRTRDRLKYAFNAVFFAFEDAVKATKEYFDSLDPIISKGIALPAGLPTSISSALEQVRDSDKEKKHDKEHGLKRKRSAAAIPDLDPENPPPKRAMTPFFLFLSQNRQRIKLDLESRRQPATMIKISEEATRRWKELSLDEKGNYDREYKFNLELYKRQLKEWKTSVKPVGKAPGIPTVKASGPVVGVDEKAPQPVVPVEVVSTPMTDGRKKKKHRDGKEKDRSHKSRSEKRKEAKRRLSIDPLATPTPAAKMSSAVTPIGLSGADRSDKLMKVRHGDKEKVKTPKSEKKEKRRKEKERMLQLGEKIDIALVDGSKRSGTAVPSPKKSISQGGMD